MRYVGPLDGHDIAGMEQAFRQAAAYRRPYRRPRPSPKKGRGYGPAEDDEEKCLHDAALF